MYSNYLNEVNLIDVHAWLIYIYTLLLFSPGDSHSWILAIYL